MNLIISRFPGIRFNGKPAVIPNSTAMQLPVLPPLQDTFEKSDKTRNNSPEASVSSKTAVSKYSSPDYTTASILYIADIHGKMTNMERICEMAKIFDSTSTANAK